jgi:hypothetical protein
MGNRSRRISMPWVDSGLSLYVNLAHIVDFALR